MTPFQELSLDKECKIAVDAKNKGTWHSTFCDATYRNFYAYNQTWTDATIFYKSVALDDIRIKYIFNFRSVVANRAFLSGVGLSGYVSSNGTVGVIAGSIVSNPLNYSFTPTTNTTNEVIIERVSGVFKIFFNGINVVTRTGGTYVDLSALTGNLVSEHDGNLTYFKIDNLTKSTSWQASDAQIKNSDAIFPSPILRNFITEPATFNDFPIKYNAIGTDDFKFEILFNINPCTGKSVFYPASTNRIGIYRGGAYTSYDFYLTISKSLDIGGTLTDTYTSLKIGASTADNIYGVFKCKFQRIGATVKIFWNDVEIYSRTGDAPSSLSEITGGVANFDGNILSAKLTNLTSNTVLWSYPNFEEKTRLITKVNTYTDNGYFEGAFKTASVSASNAWNIKTQLNLLGKPLNSTYYCRAYLGNMDGAPAASTQRLTNSSTDNTRALFVRYAGSAYSLNFYFQARTATGSTNEYISYTNSLGVRALLDKWTDFVVVLDNVSRMMYLYADGALLASKAFAVGNIGYYYIAAAYPLYIGSLATTECRQDLTKIDQFQYFDRVLTDSEIRSFTYDTEKVIDIDITTIADSEEVYLSDTTATLTSDLIVNWGDGTTERIVRNSTNYTKISHVYLTAGNYKITASGRLSLSYSNEITKKQAWRYINKFDMVKMGFVSCNYTFQAKSLAGFSNDIIIPNYITNCIGMFNYFAIDIPLSFKIPNSVKNIYSMFDNSKITRIRNGFTFGNIQGDSSMAYLFYRCTELIEVEDGVKYPASLTASQTSQTAFHYANCGKLEHLSVNLFDDFNMDNLIGNAFRDFARECIKLKNFPNNMRFSALINDLTYVALNCYELEWDITDKFPIFPNGSNIQMTSAFAWCRKITGYVDPVKLWKRTDITWSKTDAFKNCTALTNYDEIPASWGGLATVSISTNRTWTDVWTDKTANIAEAGSLTCTDNKGIINMVSGSNLTITTNTGTINYVAGSIINGTTKSTSGSLVGGL